MRHRLFTFLSLVSLLLCMATCILWARSARGDVFSKLGPRGFELISSNGRLAIWTYYGFPVSYPFRWRTGNVTFRYWEVDGLRYSGEGVWPGTYSWMNASEGYTDYLSNDPAHLPLTRVSWKTVELPHWPIVLITGVMPVLWVQLWQRRVTTRRRAMRGLCLACGYDLRASPERCPECGHEAKSETHAL